MLVIPTKGIAKSVNKHNVHLDVMCDWIEGSVLFYNDEPSLSQIDIADVLLEEQRYVEQDFALIAMKDAWRELERRALRIGQNSAINLNARRVERKCADWRDNAGYSFCLLLSLAPFYDWWKEDSYSLQGELFELLTEASLKSQFRDWQIVRTGWSSENPVRLRDVAVSVAECLGETLGDIDTWDDPYTKELGLDILCYRAFPDNRRGIPVYLMQCASGNDWDLKLHTPDLAIWGDIIHFKNSPLKAFATPFSFLDKEHDKCASRVRGLFFDRYRLMGANRDSSDWVDAPLKQRLISWCEPRITQLLKMSA